MDERLTKEEIKNCYDYHSQGRKCGKILLLRTCNELLEYKQIEKELGIDLITLFKAIANENNLGSVNFKYKGTCYAIREIKRKNKL